jgi:hypothetical protein
MADERGTVVRAAIILTVGSLLIFAAAFVTRRAFVADVTPVSWDQETVSIVTLFMAYLLLSIENIAAAVAVISLVAGLVLWFRRLTTKKTAKAKFGLNWNGIDGDSSPE